MSGNNDGSAPRYEGSRMYELPDTLRVDKQQIGFTIPMIITVLAAAFGVGVAYTATESSINTKMVEQAAAHKAEQEKTNGKLDDLSKDFKEFRNIFVGEDGQLKGKWQKVGVRTTRRR